MVFRSLVLGYHGCDASTVDKLVNGLEKQIPSEKPHDWLGSGLYFWEDSYSRAWKWAQAEAKNPESNIQEPAVLGAVIDLGNCLNLIDAESLELVRSAHRAFLDICNISGLTPPQNKERAVKKMFLEAPSWVQAAGFGLQPDSDSWQDGRMATKIIPKKIRRR